MSGLGATTKLPNLIQKKIVTKFEVCLLLGFKIAFTFWQACSPGITCPTILTQGICPVPKTTHYCRLNHSLSIVSNSYVSTSTTWLQGNFLSHCTWRSNQNTSKVYYSKLESGFWTSNDTKGEKRKNWKHKINRGCMGERLLKFDMREGLWCVSPKATHFGVKVSIRFGSSLNSRINAWKAYQISQQSKPQIHHGFKSRHVIINQFALHFRASANVLSGDSAKPGKSIYVYYKMKMKFIYTLPETKMSRNFKPSRVQLNVI